MTQQTDFRALCAELLSVFDNYDDESNLAGIFDDMKANKNDLLDRARAALAEPVAEVLTDDRDKGWQWYAYCPEEGLEMYSDREQAQSAAQSIMGSYEAAAHSDGWHEDMESVSWGMLVPVEQAQVVEHKIADPDSEFDEWVKYELRPARAALAEPEPKVAEPTYSEVLAIRDELDANGYGTVDLVAFARAVLARYGHQPAPPAAGEVRKFVDALRCEAVAAEGDPLWMSPSELRRAAELLQQQQAAPVPVPLAEGEVAELVAWLRGANWDSKRQSLATRAADLLEQRHPTPVPVSERLPGPEDCDPSTQCWWFTPSEEKWVFCPIKWAGPEYTHWLPAHALPLPQGEVE